MAKRQKSKYKRMQREADAEVQVNNKSLFSKIFKSKN